MPNQAISLLNSRDDPSVIAALDDDNKPLGFYGVRDWQVLRVRFERFYCMKDCVNLRTI